MHAAMLFASPAALDPSAEWIVAHPDEVAKHRGELLAVHLVRGIIAHGKDFGEVMEKRDAMGLDGATRDAILLSPALG